MNKQTLEFIEFLNKHGALMKYIKNCIKHRGTVVFVPILAAFVLSYTPEGADYWYDLETVSPLRIH